jgi:glutamine amidotransferase
VIRSASSQQAVPAQGNIKKKRAGATLTALEAVNTLPYVDTSPVTPEPERTEFGNPNKIARMFPELALQ